jgi:hypothetical protein
MLSSWSLSYIVQLIHSNRSRGGYRESETGSSTFHQHNVRRRGPEAGALESCHLGSAVAQVCAICPHSLAPGQRTRENNAAWLQRWEGGDTRDDIGKQTWEEMGSADAKKKRKVESMNQQRMMWEHGHSLGMDSCWASNGGRLATTASR